MSYSSVPCQENKSEGKLWKLALTPVEKRSMFPLQQCLQPTISHEKMRWGNHCMRTWQLQEHKRESNLRWTLKELSQRVDGGYLCWLFLPVGSEYIFHSQELPSDQPLEAANSSFADSATFVVNLHPPPFFLLLHIHQLHPKLQEQQASSLPSSLAHNVSGPWLELWNRVRYESHYA